MLSSDKTLNNIIVYIYRYGNPVICILGNIGNFLSVIIFLKKSWRRNVCVFYFLIYLFVSSIYLNFTILGFTFFIGFDIKFQNFNIIFCKLFYFIPFFVSTLLPTILIAASFDRLFVSPWNVDTLVYRSKRFAYVSISMSAAFWFIFNFPMLADVNRRIVNSTVFVCSYNASYLPFEFVYYSLVIIEVIFCLLFVILCILSLQKLCRIQYYQRRPRKQIRSMTNKDFQLLHCLCIHNIIYIISTIFTVVFSVYSNATQFQKRTVSKQAMHDFLSDLFIFFSFVYYSTSFIIFIVGSKAFRNELKRLLFKIFNRQLLSKKIQMK